MDAVTRMREAFIRNSIDPSTGLSIIIPVSQATHRKLREDGLIALSPAQEYNLRASDQGVVAAIEQHIIDGETIQVLNLARLPDDHPSKPHPSLSL